jgi:hypothetical protein
MSITRACVLLVCALALAAPAAAQTATFNPRTVVVTPSADYNVQLADGTNLTTGLRLQYFLSGVNPATGSPVTTVNLCKPPLTTAGTVVVTGTACNGGLLFATPLLSNTTYFATSTQYGPGGESARSPASNPFVLSGAPRSPLSVTLQQ